jgi:hypothetical protein
MCLPGPREVEVEVEAPRSHVPEPPGVLFGSGCANNTPPPRSHLFLFISCTAYWVLISLELDTCPQLVVGKRYAPDEKSCSASLCSWLSESTCPGATDAAALGAAADLALRFLAKLFVVKSRTINWSKRTLVNSPNRIGLSKASAHAHLAVDCIDLILDGARSLARGRNQGDGQHQCPEPCAKPRPHRALVKS